jgi:hypothetical protein
MSDYEEQKWHNGETRRQAAGGKGEGIAKSVYQILVIQITYSFPV